MFRTRDFVLYAVIVVFLLIGIGTTIVVKRSSGVSGPEAVQLANAPASEYGAEIYEEPSLSREERVALMKQKVAESQAVTLSEPDSDDGDVVPESPEIAPDEDLITVPTTTALVPVLNEPLLCPVHQSYAGDWPRSGVQVEAVEGARLIFTEEEVERVVATTTTTETQQTVLLQLPMLLGPAALPNCLSTDVVGVAKDGSLIRNGEVGLYGIFSAETLVGYALDGFPIYGVSDVRGDTCGGVMENGQYRYYLSTERETILNCFSAPPRLLP